MELLVVGLALAALAAAALLVAGRRARRAKHTDRGAQDSAPVRAERRPAAAGRAADERTGPAGMHGSPAAQTEAAATAARGAVAAGSRDGAEPARARTPAGAATLTPGATSAAATNGAAPYAEAPPRSAAPPSTHDPGAADGLAELRERRVELGRIEERLLGKEQSADARLADLERRERSLDDRARNLDGLQADLKAARQQQLRELERVAGLSRAQAKQLLLRELEDDLKHERARMIRQSEEEARRDVERRARNILATCMQRIAGGHAAETTVSVVPLKSDDLKGRVIGREGRNIRALETLTGIDFIIDDTPSAVVLSGFDGVRREIARLTLERLLQDGRIHPARIEDAFEQASREIEDQIVAAGEQAVFEASVGSLHPELVKLLGRLRFRTSYGQNVLAHSVECAGLAAMIAHELGASARTARRAALLHDIGKAVSHEIEGPHALVGGDLARRYGEAEAIAHAMEAHHNEVEMQTVEAVIVQVADALSGARPGARGESLEQYVKRLRDLEGICTRHPGVDKVYAMQAGREVRVIVSPDTVDDDEAALLSHRIARDVEKELEYPGQIKVTVIRESRAVNYAK